jgi:aspartate aminotransferase
VPQGAFYAFPNISALIGAGLGPNRITDGNSLAEMLLNEAQVATVGGNDFGAPDHLRISYATSIDNLNRAFDRIENLLRRLER